MTFSNGTITGDGSGQTIAIIDWGHDANIGSDLDAFDTYYGVSGGSSSTFLTVYAQSTADNLFHLASSIPQNLPQNALTLGTDLEISLDVEWAHSLAPGAKLVLVEARDATTANLTAAIDYAKQISGVSVVSMSFGGTDSSVAFGDLDLSRAGVTFVASTGDYGSYNNPIGFADSLYNSWAGTGLGDGTDYFGDVSTGTYGSDFFFETQVESGTNGTQAGISIRNGTSATAATVANVSLLVRPGSTGIFQDRATDGGATTNTISSGFTAPVGTYLAVLRQGTTYYAYTSTNGSTWNLISYVTVPAMSGSVTIDLVGASGSNSTTKTFNFGGNGIYGGTIATDSPGTSANVVAIGGTSPTADTSGNITGETAVWGSGTLSFVNGGGGGGYSSFEARPAYQAGVSVNGARAVPDVSFDAAALVSVYDSNPSQTLVWNAVGGTSFSAPAWAALLAVADQGRVLAGLPTLTSSQSVSQALPTVQSLLYSVASSDFNDITTGSIGAYQATTGYDVASGLGTPHAAALVADLSAWVQDSGFETGALFNSALSIGWSHTGTVSVVDGGSPHSGSYAARLSSGSSISQTINGLLPNTTYTVSAFGKVDSGTVATLTASVGGGSVTFNASTYGQQAVTFTTDANTTSVTLTLASTSGTGYVYFDDVALLQAYTYVPTNSSVSLVVNTTTGAIDIKENGVLKTSFPMAAPRALIIDGGANNETITLDQTAGNASFIGGLIVKGSGNDVLQVSHGAMTFKANIGASAPLRFAP